jgi:ureidoacrylate peracid hydrolase
MRIPLGPGKRNFWLVDEDTCDLRRHPGPGWEIEAQPQNIVLDSSRAALVVIDMQNDFCHADGWLASIGVDIAPARMPIRPLQRLLPALRAQETPVIWCSWGNRPDRANLPPGVLHVYNPDGRHAGIGDSLANGGPVLQAGSWGAAIVDELVPHSTDIVVDKYRMSGFWDTPLDSVLRNLDLTTVFFAGVNVDQCVLATLIDAACAGYDCILLTDCSATTSPSYCWDATIYNVKQCFGFVTTGTSVLKSLP